MRRHVVDLTPPACVVAALALASAAARMWAMADLEYGQPATIAPLVALAGTLGLMSMAAYQEIHRSKGNRGSRKRTPAPRVGRRA